MHRYVRSRTRRTPLASRILHSAAVLACVPLLLLAAAPSEASAALSTGVSHIETDDAGATDSGATDTEATDTDAAELNPELVVSPTTALFEADEDQYEFTVLLRNPSKLPVGGGTLTLKLDLDRITEVDGLTKEFPRSSSTLATIELPETAAESEQAVSVLVPREDVPFSLNTAAGVYRVQAMLRSESQSADAPPAPHVYFAYTPLVWNGLSSPSTVDVRTVEVSTVVPLLLPPDVLSMPTRDQLENAAPDLSALLTAAEAARSTVAIDPRIIASVRAYGTEAPTAARELLDELERTRTPTFLLQFADADPAVQAALGYESLLRPTGLEFITRYGSFVADEASLEDEQAEKNSQPGTAPDQPGFTPDQPGVTPEAPGTTREGESTNGDAVDGDAANENTEEGDTEEGDADVQEPQPPSLDELLAWEAPLVAWPARNAVDAQTLKLLAASDIDTVVLDAGNVTGRADPQIELGAMRGVVAETALSNDVRDALAASSETEHLNALATATARLALAAEEDSGGLVVALDRPATAANESAALILEELTSLDWVTPTPIETQAVGAGTLKEGSSSQSRQDALEAASTREEEVVALSPLLENPEYLSGYQRSRLLSLFATGYGGSDPTAVATDRTAGDSTADARFEMAVKRFEDRDAELLQAVYVIPSANTQLVGTSSRIPVQMHNALPFEVSVAGEARPASAGLTVVEREIPPTRVTAGGNQTVLVPVRSRVASGESGLVVTLSDAAGTQEFYSGAVPISISSAVESIALGALGVLAATLLGFGVWRSVKRHHSVTVSGRSKADSLSGRE